MPTKDGFEYRFRLSHVFWMLTLIAFALTILNYQYKVEHLRARLTRRPFPTARQKNYDFVANTSVLISCTEQHFFEISICHANNNALNVLVGPVTLDSGDYVVSAFIDEPLSIFGFSLSQANELKGELYYTHLTLPKGAKLKHQKDWITDKPKMKGVYSTRDTNGNEFTIQIVRKERGRRFFLPGS